MTPLICPRCLTVVVAAIAPTIGGKPQKCPCLDKPPFVSGVNLVRLRIPEAFELRRKEPAT